jgi:predicted Holliday junction resolvase-like endonuclease
MKETQSTIAIFLGGIALVLTIVLVGVSISNRSLERKLQVQQGAIQAGQTSQQVGSAIVRDAATIAVQNNNSQLRELLGKHGITINTNNTAK